MLLWAFIFFSFAQHLFGLSQSIPPFAGLYRVPLRSGTHRSLRRSPLAVYLFSSFIETELSSKIILSLQLNNLSYTLA